MYNGITSKEAIMPKRQKRGNHSSEPSLHNIVDSIDPVPPVKPKSKLEPKTEAQRRYISSILHNKITFGMGPAGTGKTYCAARVASAELLAKNIHKIYLTRPAVESGTPIGFLKGTMEEKMAPYMAAYGPGFRDGLGEGCFEYMLRTGRIEIVPLNFMQGRSFDEPSMVLFDEAQNATIPEMKMFLTRIGDGARMIIDGDHNQRMIKDKSGLIDGLRRIGYLDQVGAIEFERSDIVRHGLVRQILDAYDEENDEEEPQLELPGFITQP